MIFPTLTARRLTPFLALALVACVFVLLPEHAYAADTFNFKRFIDTSLSPISLAVAGVAVIVSWVTIFLTTYMAVFAGGMMSSTYIFDSGMGETLQLVWTILRNFVNISFIVILLVIAVMVILRIGEDGGMKLLTKSLKTIVIALVAVNFTFFGCRVVLTASDVLSTIIFTIPSMVPTMPGQMQYLCAPDNQNISQCQEYLSETFNKVLNGQPNTAASRGEVAGKVGSLQKAIASIQHTMKDMPVAMIQNSFDKQNSVFAIMLYLYGLTKPISVRLEGMQMGADLFIDSLFALVTTVLVGLIIFALLLGMIVRAVILWLTIAVMPLVALGYVLKETLHLEGGSDFNPLDEFVKAAFLPVFVAMPLSLGFVLIMAGSSLTISPSDALIQSVNNRALSDILWWVGGIVVLWVGTKQALAKSSYVAQFTDGVFEMGNGMMNGIKGLAGHVPLIPVGGITGNKNEKASVSSLLAMPSRVMDAHRAADAAHTDALLRGTGFGPIQTVSVGPLLAAAEAGDREAIKTLLNDPNMQAALQGRGEDAQKARLEIAKLIKPDDTRVTGAVDGKMDADTFNTLLKDHESEASAVLGHDNMEDFVKKMADAFKEAQRNGGGAGGGAVVPVAQMNQSIIQLGRDAPAGADLTARSTQLATQLKTSWASYSGEQKTQLKNAIKALPSPAQKQALRQALQATAPNILTAPEMADAFN